MPIKISICSLKIVLISFFCFLLSLSSVNCEDLPFTVGQILAAPKGMPDPNKPMVRMVVTQFAHPNHNEPIIQRTVEAFQKEFGENNFEAQVFPGEEVLPETADLVLSSTGTYIRSLKNGARDLATVISNRFPDPNYAEGSVFVVLKDHPELEKLTDLKGKVATGTGEHAFSGMQIALGEIAANGENPDNFFSSVVYSGLDMRKALDLLKAGKADVAIVRTCFLEELEASGTDISPFKTIGVKGLTAPAKCVTSTDLYPNWTVFATPAASPDIARRATVALLNMSADSEGRRWGVASDFWHTDNLFKTIRHGPYEYLRTWTWERFWEEYRFWILGFLFVVLGIILHSLRATYLVKVRTAQLSKTKEEQLAAEKAKHIAQSRIQSLQKAGAIGQMSSIIAHELRQPLSAVISYGHGLQRMIENGRMDSSTLSKGIEYMQNEAKKAEAIVQKVRSYAKGQMSSRQNIDLEKIVKTAASTLNKSRPMPPVEITGSCKAAYADPLEAELAVLNLIKNAAEALEGRKDAQILVHLSDSNGRCLVSVKDNGEKLSDEQFEKLVTPVNSDKLEGLGLGLSIVKLITENHGGTLKFTRGFDSGLTAEISFPVAQQLEEGANGH